MFTENEKNIIANALENASNTLDKIDTKTLKERMQNENGVECSEELIDSFKEFIKLWLNACIEQAKLT